MGQITSTYTYQECDEIARECRKLKYKLYNAQDDAMKAAWLGTGLSLFFCAIGAAPLGAIVGLIGIGLSIEANKEDFVKMGVRNCQYGFEDAETYLYDNKDKYDRIKIRVNYVDYTTPEGTVIPLPQDTEVVAIHIKGAGWQLFE